MPDIIPRQNGRVDWPELADRVTEPFVPGNWFNSQNRRINDPLTASGLGGVAQQVGRAAQRIGSVVARGPIQSSRPRANVPRLQGSDVIQDQTPRGEVNPRVGSPERAGNQGQSTRRGLLGAGQLGSGGDAAVMDYSQRMASRGGLLAER